MSASGGFAGALVFAKSRGVNYVRQLVTPANPRTLSQENNRNNLRISAQAQHWVTMQTVNRPGQTLKDKAIIMTKAIAGLAWNSSLVKAMIGTNSISFNADATSYNALTAGQKTAWDTAAAALAPPIMAVSQTTTGGISATAATAGRVYWHHVSAMWRLGAVPQPTGTPPAAL